MSYFNATIRAPNGEGIKLYESDGTNAITFLANTNVSSDYTLKFPGTLGSANQYLKLADATGTLTFDTVTASSAADDITEGDAAVNITTTAGNVDVNSQAGNVNISAGPSKTIYLKTQTSIDSTLDVSGVTSITDTTEATSTIAASLKTAGGLGVAKDIYAGNDVHLASDAAVLNFGADNDVSLTHVADTGLLLNSTREIQFSSSASNIYASATANLDLNSTNININATTTRVNNALTIGGAVNIDDTTTSTSTSTGALIVDGGLGVAENLNVGGNMVVTGNFTVNGTTTTVNSNVTTIDDPVIELGINTIGADDGLDRGVIFHYHDGVGTRHGFFGYDNSENVFTYYSNIDYTAGANVFANTANTVLGSGKFASVTTTSGINVGSDIYPTSADGAALGTSANEWSDLYLADGAVIYLGNDQDVTLTHVADTGLLLNTNMQFQFRDSALYINSSTDGQLDIVADNTVKIAATTANVTGNLETSGTLDVAGDVTAAADLSVGNSLFIGVDSITSVVAATEIITSTLKSSVKSFKLNSATAATYHSNAGSQSGQMLHIFYDNLNSSGSANIDFGASGLYVGSGTARFLTFTQTGQSATLVYIDGSDANSAGWRIINTGGTVS